MDELVEQAESDQEEEDDEYHRPSYMFHWLKEIGRDMQEKFEAFRTYQGESSYREAGLELPSPFCP